MSSFSSVSHLRSLPRQLRPHVRASFSTSTRRSGSSFLDLQARSVSRENGHFAKLSRSSYFEHSPALQLLRSERDLAESRVELKKREGGVERVKSSPILLTTHETTRSIDGNASAAIAEELEDYKRRYHALLASLKENGAAWQNVQTANRQAYDALDEKFLRSRLLNMLLLVVAGLLTADALSLANEVDQHCPGCFDGNAKNTLFLVGPIKRTTDWIAGDPSKNKATTSQDQPVRKVQETLQKGRQTQGAPGCYESDDLPEGWERQTTSDGRSYFVNLMKQFATLEDPRETSSSSPILKTTKAIEDPQHQKPSWGIMRRLFWAK